MRTAGVVHGHGHYYIGHNHIQQVRTAGVVHGHGVVARQAIVGDSQIIDPAALFLAGRLDATEDRTDHYIKIPGGYRPLPAMCHLECLDRIGSRGRIASNLGAGSHRISGPDCIECWGWIASISGPDRISAIACLARLQGRAECQHCLVPALLSASTA